MSRILSVSKYFSVLLILITLGACTSPDILTVVVTEIVDGEVVEIVVTQPASNQPDRDTIVYCAEQEPSTLYAITGGTEIGGVILTATDGKMAINDREYFFETQMLVDDALPSFESGDVVIEDESLSVTYRYKPGITWSDGEPFTVDDVLFTRNVILDPESGAITTGLLEHTTYEKLDDLTLKVTWAPGIIDPFYYLPPYAMPEHALGDMSPAEILVSDYAFLPDPVLGPYEFVEWVGGDNVRLRAIDNWWGGEIEVPNLVFRFITDSNQLIASIISGECDYGLAQANQLPIIREAAAKDLIQYQAVAATVWEHIDFNTYPPANAEEDGLPFFADKRVRQAVAYGTNRQQMTDEILYGEVTPMNSYLPPEHWAYNPDLDDLYPYDPDQARTLLEDAGWVPGEDGYRVAADDLSGTYDCQRGEWTIPADTRFEVSFHTVSGNAMREQLSTIFADNMKELGLNVRLDLLPSSVWFGDLLFQRQFQIGEFAWVTSADPAAANQYAGMNMYRTPENDFLAADSILALNSELLQGTGLARDIFAFGRPDESQLPEGYELAFPEKIPSEANNWDGQNIMGWCNVEATESIVLGDNQLTQEERLPYYLEFQRIFAEEMPSLPLFQRLEISVFSPALCGLEKGPSNRPTWNIETWTFVAPGEQCL